MGQFSLTKQPSESFFVGVNFSARLGQGELLDQSNCSVVVTNPQGVDVTAALVEINSLYVNGIDTVVQRVPVKEGTGLFVRIKGGEATQRYVYSFRAATTEGNLLEEDVFVLVNGA